MRAELELPACMIMVAIVLILVGTGSLVCFDFRNLNPSTPLLFVLSVN